MVIMKSAKTERSTTLVHINATAAHHWCNY